MTAKSVKSDLVRWVLALVPYNARTFEADRRRIIYMDGEGTGSHRTLYRAFYEALLVIPWLAPKVRRAVMAELGRSLREQNRGIEKARTAALRWSIGERKRQLREQGKRPRGGIHEKAVEDIARTQGMTIVALKKRLQRDKRRQK